MTSFHPDQLQDIKTDKLFYPILEERSKDHGKTGRTLTDAYNHPQSLSVPIRTDGKNLTSEQWKLIAPADNGFAPGFRRAKIGKGKRFFRWESADQTGGPHLFVYRNKVPTTIIVGFAAPLAVRFSEDPNSNRGGARQFCIDGPWETEFVKWEKRRANHEEHKDRRY